MHYAYLHNVLGIHGIAGTQFQEIARRQASEMGAVISGEEVTSVADDTVCMATADSGSHEADHLILTEGKTPDLARSLGPKIDDDPAVVVDRDNRSSLQNVYTVGRSVRPTRSQTIISAGGRRRGTRHLRQGG